MKIDISNFTFENLIFFIDLHKGNYGIKRYGDTIYLIKE